MSTVLRIKRRYDEDPIETLVISCKKRKLDSTSFQNNDEPITQVLKFVATVKNQNDSIVKHISPATQEGVKSLLNYKPDIRRKIKKEIENKSRENRLKVVNCFRALNDEEENNQNKENAAESDSNITVFDIIKDSEKKDPLEKSEENDDSAYVYDLYYTDIPTRETCSPDFSDSFIDNLLSVHAVNMQELVNYGSDSEEYPNFGEDEDSNDENNWRNDYPDSDSSEGDDYTKMAKQIKGLHIEGNEDYQDLSSDDEDRLVWSEDASLEDIQCYGYAYAAYKKRIINEETNSDEEEAYDSYYSSLEV